MSEANFPIDTISLLKNKITTLNKKIESIEQELFPFEQTLRNAISDLLVEERELTVVYKQQKKAKKEKRLAQKRKGKNFKFPEEVKLNIPEGISKVSLEERKERKRVYKEAILFVHPDKFSMKPEEQDKATEVTTKLIEIYKNGSLAALKAFHAHIFNGHTNIVLEANSAIEIKADGTRYLNNEINRLEKELEELLNRHTFKVLKEYENPLSFIEELKEYYIDRIFKLKKRTRTK